MGKDEVFLTHVKRKANVPFLYFLKSSENQTFSDVYKWYRNGTLACNGLKQHIQQLALTRSKLTIETLEEAVEHIS